MSEPYWWYVFFVRGGTESRVVKKIQLSLDLAGTEYSFESFIFESEQYFRNKKNRILGKQYQKKPQFPGYVFVETNMPPKQFLERFSDLILKISDIIKILNNGMIEDIAVPTAERHQLEYLYRGKRCIEHSIGYKEGDKIRIVQGPLIGREGLIKYINRHNREAIIEIKMFNRITTMKVAVELLAK